MAVDLLAELRKLLGMAEADTGDAADGIGEADVEGDEVEADEVDDLDSTTDDTVENDSPVDEDAPEAGTGDTNADEVAADDAEETMPDSEVSVAELRDALGKLGSENERLRNLVAELGGDAALGDDETEDVVEDEVDPEYDDEAAQKDLDEQERQIASLSRK